MQHSVYFLAAKCPGTRMIWRVHWPKNIVQGFIYLFIDLYISITVRLDDARVQKFRRFEISAVGINEAFDL
jgi:hypothetical protein